MTERYFSPREVEALIPSLAAIMARVQDARVAAAQSQEALHAEKRRLGQVGGGVIDARRWQTDAARLASATATLRKGVDEIQTMGGVIKDLALGLVDFPHLRDGHVVNLCWKPGEDRIRWWHGLDEGYTARKPL